MALVRALKTSGGGFAQIPDTDTIRAGQFGADGGTGPASVVLENSNQDALTLSGGSAQLSSGVNLSSAN
jgi:hypothetical protein